LSEATGPAPDRLLDLLSAPMFGDREMERDLANTLPLGVVWRRVVSE
jgi:hypothetical protein